MFQNKTIKETQNEIGKWCKQLRKQENISQGELADLLMLSRITISNLEKGENVTLDTFLKVLQHFHQLQSVYDFVKNQNETPPSLY